MVRVAVNSLEEYYIGGSRAGINPPSLVVNCLTHQSGTREGGG